MHATLYIVSSPLAQEVPEGMEEFLWKYTLRDSSPPNTLHFLDRVAEVMVAEESENDSCKIYSWR